MANENDIGGKVGLDITDFKANIADLNRQIKVIDSGFKAAAAGMDDWGKSEAGLQTRIKSLNEITDLQRQKVANLTEQYAKVAAEKGENSKAAQDLLVRINKETESLNNNEKGLRDAQSSLDGYGNETEEAEQKTEDMDKSLGKLGQSLATVGGAAAKAAVAGLAAVGTAAAAAALAIGTKVVGAFGELEQNLGGSEAVFGEYASAIQKTGEEAYKNLGVSQSEYLATANKMGALFQGSGVEQQRSLELTEQAMQRAADMASVMGIDTAAALEAVNGAAKGNYTMMDNLGVAMNATTLEAYALSSGIQTAYKDMSQTEKTELAMKMFFEKTEQYAGNFAKESTQTISGSLGLLKSSIESLTAGLGNSEADITNLTGNVVDAFSAVIANVVPIIKNLAAALPQAVKTALAEVVGIAPEIIPVFVDLFGEVLSMIGSLLPEVVVLAVDLVQSLVDGIIDNIPMLTESAIKIVMSLIDGIISMLPMLADGALQLIIGLAMGIGQALPQLIPTVIEVIGQIVKTLIDNVPMLIDAALQLVLGLVDSILDLLPELIPAAIGLIVTLANGIIDALPKLIEKIPEIVETIVNVIVQNLPLLITAAVKIIVQLVSTIISNLPMIIKAAIQIIAALVKGILGAIPEVLAVVPKLFSELLTAFKNSKWGQLGIDLMQGIIEGVKDTAKNLANSVVEAAKGALDGAKKFLGIHSPSRVMRDQVGKMIPAGMAEGIKDSAKQVNAAMDAMNRELTVSPVINPAPKHNPSAGSSGGSQVTNNFEGMVSGNTFVVRNDEDIDRLSQKLGGYVADNIRGGGE
ncbi:phage tail protein [Paenibacillus brevis]|uniref:Phage tail protein n=1 Tax=Paenibacillus brevis TaxID=2841508 RepID=A0ABS6FJM2_9BACL|nr:phage tail protein [Paenibacillus brevis]MBU5670248.1 phage tail protein [Paenibacillus brevis]